MRNAPEALRRISNLCSFLLLLSGCDRQPALPAAEIIANPLTLRSVNGDLSVELSAQQDLARDRPALTYRGHVGAPTLRLWPGDTIHLTLHNRLRLSSLSANAVNLHFHGLNVSPSAPADDVLGTLATPGQTLHYIVRIPKTQPPGLYWYHPHSHGEAYWQVTSGMSGAIVVEGLQERTPVLAGVRERILVLRDEQPVPNIMWIPSYSRPVATIAERGALRRLGQPHAALTDPDDSGGQPCSSERSLQVTVQGTDRGYIGVAPGEPILLRVLNASGGRVFDLELPGERLGLVAVDGYPLDAYSGTPALVWRDHVELPPGGRVEFVAVGQSSPSLLQSRCYDSGPAGDLDPAIVLAELRPDPSVTSAKGSSWKGDRPDSSATQATMLPIPTRNRTIAFTENGDGFFIDGHRFSMSAMKPAFTARAGTIEQWTLRNETDEVHAFHLHQVHFVVRGVNGAPPADLYWRDVVLVPPQHHDGNRTTPGLVTIDVDFRDRAIRGLFPFHCHMLDHEDGGMMAILRVL
jgi:suppressor of ftsI